MSMKKYDQIFGLVWVALGVVMAIDALRLGLWKDGAPGSGFMPLTIAVLLGLSGFSLTVSATFSTGQEEGNTVVWGDMKSLFIPLVALLVYISVLTTIGFLLATFLFQFFLLKFTAPKKWVVPMVTSLLIVVFCHVVFSLWFKLQLPAGILGIG
jgi:putative tricarboxylic transport membrane protein